MESVAARRLSGGQRNGVSPLCDDQLMQYNPRPTFWPLGGIGRRAGFKILFPYGSIGSTPIGATDERIARRFRAILFDGVLLANHDRDGRLPAGGRRRSSTQISSLDVGVFQQVPGRVGKNDLAGLQHIAAVRDA